MSLAAWSAWPVLCMGSSCTKHLCSVMLSRWKSAHILPHLSTRAVAVRQWGPLPGLRWGDGLPKLAAGWGEGPASPGSQGSHLHAGAGEPEQEHQEGTLPARWWRPGGFRHFNSACDILLGRKWNIHWCVTFLLYHHGSPASWRLDEQPVSVVLLQLWWPENLKSVPSCRTVCAAAGHFWDTWRYLFDFSLGFNFHLDWEGVSSLQMVTLHTCKLMADTFLRFGHKWIVSHESSLFLLVTVKHDLKDQNQNQNPFISQVQKYEEFILVLVVVWGVE